jgi:hypothetical protein
MSEGEREVDADEGPTERLWRAAFLMTVLVTSSGRGASLSWASPDALRQDMPPAPGRRSSLRLFYGLLDPAIRRTKRRKVVRCPGRRPWLRQNDVEATNLPGSGDDAIFSVYHVANMARRPSRYIGWSLGMAQGRSNWPTTIRGKWRRHP